MKMKVLEDFCDVRILILGQFKQPMFDIDEMMAVLLASGARPLERRSRRHA
jgi:hypothetical protein